MSTSLIVSRKLAEIQHLKQERVRKIAEYVVARVNLKVKQAAGVGEVIDSVKGHVSDNRNAYMGGAVGAVTGGVVGAATGGKGKRVGRAILGSILGGSAGAGVAHYGIPAAQGAMARRSLEESDTGEEIYGTGMQTAKGRLDSQRAPFKRVGPYKENVPDLVRGKDDISNTIAPKNSWDDGMMPK